MFEQRLCKMRDMRNIKIPTGRYGPPASVRETETPNTWELEWTGKIEQPHPRRVIRAAEHAVLRNGGDRLVITCRSDQEDLRAELEKWPPSIVSRDGDRYTLRLIAPADDGLIHEDFDFRTPLQRITCPTCVENIAQFRITRRQKAFGNHEGPKEIAKHSRLVAGAFTRLAEIEDNLNV